MRQISPEPSQLRLTVNIRETASALRVSPRTVRNLVARGDLKVLRIGRRVLVRIETLSAFVRDREAGTST